MVWIADLIFGGVLNEITKVVVILVLGVWYFFLVDEVYFLPQKSDKAQKV